MSFVRPPTQVIHTNKPVNASQSNMLAKRKRNERHNTPKDRQLEAVLKRLDRKPASADINLVPIPKDLLVKAAELRKSRLKEKLFGRDDEGLAELTDYSGEGRIKPHRPGRAAYNKKKKVTFTEDGHVSNHMIKTIDRQIETQAWEAKLNCTVYPDFNFKQAALKGKRPEVPSQTVVWDDLPRSARSVDQENLVFFFPKTLPDEYVADLNAKLYKYAEKFKPSTKGSNSDCKGPFIERDNQIAGSVRIVRGWNPLGHNGLEDIVPTREWVGTGEKFELTSQLVKDMEMLSHRVNAIIRHIDPVHYEDAKKLRETLSANVASYSTLASSDPLIYEGRQIIFNRVSNIHTDSQDPPKAWSVMAILGEFTEGYIEIPHLGLKIRSEPGDIIAVRGRVLPHEVKVWDSGQRISIPHFTHSAAWRATGITSVFVEPE